MIRARLRRALRLARIASSAAALLIVPSVRADGQTPQPQIEPLVRADAIIARQTAVQGALGVSVPFGYYVRVEADAAVGATTSADGGRLASGASARGDLLARFLLDPFVEHRFGPYIGGGLSGRYDPSVQWRTLLALIVGVDGPSARGLAPFAEVGYGGGVRLGIGVRHVSAGFR